MNAERRERGLARYAWTVVAVTIPVILWGAWVRITHSGAGCGDDWPTCRGAFLPSAPEPNTVIEFVHRATSGIVLVLFAVLAVLAWRRFGPGHRVRRAAVLAFAFVIAEAALGAGLVIFGLVEDDDSVARAVVIALHLVNTLCLLGFATLTAFWAGGGSPPAPAAARGWRWALLVAIGGTILTSMTGAITALGDTLFPVRVTEAGTWLQTVVEDVPATTHFLVELRIVHPIVAVVVGAFVAVVAGRLAGRGGDRATRRAGRVVLALVLTQIAFGLLVVLLSAPGWSQILHLALADVYWVALVVLAAAALSRTGAPRSA